MRGYCQTCRDWVDLNPDSSCPRGHPRSQIRLGVSAPVATATPAAPKPAKKDRYGFWWRINRGPESRVMQVLYALWFALGIGLTQASFQSGELFGVDIKGPAVMRIWGFPVSRWLIVWVAYCFGFVALVLLALLAASIREGYAVFLAGQDRRRADRVARRLARQAPVAPLTEQATRPDAAESGAQ